MEAGEQFVFPEYILQEQTFEVQSLLSLDGIRFMLSSFVNNFAGFAVVAVTFVAMMGVGVAEKAGMMGALIRKLVAVANCVMCATCYALCPVVSVDPAFAGPAAIAYAYRFIEDVRDGELDRLTQRYLQ